MEAPWARVLWAFAQIRETDRIDALTREGERMDLMMKFAVAINLAMTGEKAAMEEMQDAFKRRLGDKPEPASLTEKYADLLAYQDKMWAGYSEKGALATPLGIEPEPGMLIGPG